MKKSLRFLLLILVLDACTPITPTVSPEIVPAFTVTAPSPVDIPTTVTPTATSITGPASPSIPPLLQILSPLDEAVITTPTVEVVGVASAGTVVTINDDILIVGDDGQFRVTVFLEEGPNLVEIVASDNTGSETYALLTVTYEP